MVLVKINKISTLLMGNTLGKSTDHLDLWPLKTIIVREPSVSEFWPEGAQEAYFPFSVKQGEL